MDRGVIAGFQASLATSHSQRRRPYAVCSRGMMLSWVRKFFAYLVQSERLLMDPTVALRLPRMGRRLPRSTLTPKEMARLLGAPDTSTVLGLRDRALLEVLYGTGLRFSEVADLRLGDLELVERLLWVRKGKGDRDRVVPLGRWAVHWLRRYLKANEDRRRRLGTDRVFLTKKGNRLDNASLNRQLRAYARRAHIAKSLTVHALRHTFATVLIKAGADVRHIQLLLGHAVLTSTQLYTHLNVADLRKAQQRYHPRERRRKDP